MRLSGIFAALVGFSSILVAGCAGKPMAPTSVVVPPKTATASAAVECKELDCRVFDTPQQAFAEIIKEAPRVLAVGEFHALRRHGDLQTPVSRFTESLLPMLAGKASDIVIEYWVGSGGCADKEKEVVQQQRPVTLEHAPSTPNEFLLLGHRAKALGIRPHPLTATCDDYQRILKAGDDAVQEMLVLTARMFSSTARLCFQRNQAVGADKMVVTYSGAMHNDLRPDHACGEPCSFGKQLETLSGGHYVEVDLVVPQYIHDGPVWRDRVWYRYFDRTIAHPKTTLFHPYPGSYVLIFPSTEGSKQPVQTPGN